MNIEDIPEFHSMCNEDNLAVTYLMKFMKTVKILDANTTLYRYNLSNSDIRSTNVTIEQFKRLCVGASKIFEIAKELFTEEEIEKCKEWFADNQSCRCLLNMIARSPEENVEYEVKLLLQEFPIKTIQEAIKRFLVY